jgi:hypothetical protein
MHCTVLFPDMCRRRCSNNQIRPRLCYDSTFVTHSQSITTNQNVYVQVINKKAKAVTEALWGEKYSSYSFSTSALDGGEWSASRPGPRFSSGQRTTGTHCTGGWVGPRAGLDTQVRGKIISLLPRIEPRSPGHPARSQTLY